MRSGSRSGFCAFMQWDVRFMQTLCKVPPFASICTQLVQQPTVKVVENKDRRE
jgi:hypothetical protein